jgi:hypothetical protein
MAVAMYGSPEMSRRWYRHGAQVVFLGWEPSDQSFYVNIVDLCADCEGSGEVEGTEEVCPGCGGEGVQLAKMSPSERKSGLSLDQLSAVLDEQGILFPYFVQADLEEDQRTNAGLILHEYDLESEV